MNVRLFALLDTSISSEISSALSTACCDECLPPVQVRRRLKSCPIIPPVSLKKKQKHSSSPSTKEQPSCANFMLPPVSMLSLSSLNSGHLLKNPRVMHEVYHSLKATGNIKAASVYVSPILEELYWRYLERDIGRMVVQLQKGEKAKVPMRLDLLLTEMRMMLEDVQPDCRAFLEEYFCLPLLFSHLQAGQFDLTNFSEMILAVLEHGSAGLPIVRESIGHLKRYAAESNMIAFLIECLNCLTAWKKERLDLKMKESIPTLYATVVQLERHYWKGDNNSLDLTRKWLELTKENNCEKVEKRLRDERTFFIFTQGMADLIIGSDHDISIPETFLFDNERILQLHKTSNELIYTALSISLVRKITGYTKLISFDQLASLKKEIKKVLASDCCTAENLVLPICSLVDEVMQENYCESMSSLVTFLMDEYLGAHSPFFGMLARRLKEHLVDELWSRNCPLQGFDGMQTEMNAFLGECRKMALLNWAVQMHTYQALLE